MQRDYRYDSNIILASTRMPLCLDQLVIISADSYSLGTLVLLQISSYRAVINIIFMYISRTWSAPW